MSVFQSVSRQDEDAWFGSAAGSEWFVVTPEEFDGAAEGQAFWVNVPGNYAAVGVKQIIGKVAKKAGYRCVFAKKPPTGKVAFRVYRRGA